jgi:hypothetical protein
LNSKYQPPGSVLGDLHGPVALVADLFGEHPVRGLDHARIVARHAGLAQRVDRLRRIPHRRDAGLHAEGGLGHLVAGRLLDAQLLKLVAGANHLRIVLGVAQAAQRDDGVQHGRIDGAQAVGHLQRASIHFSALLQGQLAQRANVNRLGPVHDAVQNEEEIAPGDEELAVPAQAQDGVGAAAHKQLVDSLLRRNLLEGFLAYMMASGTRIDRDQDEIS